LSISPDLGLSPENNGLDEGEDAVGAEDVDEQDSQDGREDVADLAEEEVDNRLLEVLSVQSGDPGHGLSLDPGPLSSSEDEAMGEYEEGAAESPVPGRRHPAFQRPPQFKATNDLEARPQLHPLPDAFSPRRHGAKYLPGGLAGELRDWLMELKGGDEGEQLGTAEVRIIVDDVRAGPNMCIVRGHRESAGGSLMVILAGAGRMVGLRRGNIVGRNSSVNLAPPTWTIQLDGMGSWTVVCDWYTDAS
jgi:hypothetical protein